MSNTKILLIAAAALAAGYWLAKRKPAAAASAPEAPTVKTAGNGSMAWLTGWGNT